MGVGGFDRWGVGVGVRAGSREPSPFRSWPFGLRSLTHTVLRPVSVSELTVGQRLRPLDRRYRMDGEDSTVGLRPTVGRG